MSPAAALPPGKKPSWPAVKKFLLSEGLTRLGRDVCSWGFFFSVMAWMATSNLPQEVNAFFGASALSLGLGWLTFAHAITESGPARK